METLTITEIDLQGNVLKSQTLPIYTPMVLPPLPQNTEGPIGVVPQGGASPLSAPFHPLTRQVFLQSTAPATVAIGASPSPRRNGIIVFNQLVLEAIGGQRLAVL